MADKTTLSEGETREVMQIRADIAQTRAELTDTLGAIQEKLSPTRLREHAMDTVREATIGRVENMAGRIGDKMSDTGRGVMGFMRNNPVPLALIGLGAGWLTMNLRGRGRMRGEYRGRESLRESRLTQPLGYESGTFYGETVVPTHEADYYGGRTIDGGRAGSRMQHARERLSETASHIGERVSRGASETGERVRERASSFVDRTRSIAHDTGEHARDFAHTATEKYEENPFFGGMLALALGAATGMMIPISDRERRMMGSRSRELLSHARDMGRDRLERVRHVAEEVASDTKDFVKRSVQEHRREEGLTFGESGRSSSESGTGFGDRPSGEFGPEL